MVVGAGVVDFGGRPVVTATKPVVTVVGGGGGGRVVGGGGGGFVGAGVAGG